MFSRKVLCLGLGLVAGSTLQGAWPPPSSETGKAVPVFARARLSAVGTSGTTGLVEFARTSKGLLVVAEVRGASAGAHGIHVHQNGSCSGAKAEGAGDHFNPTHGPHGLPRDTRSHAGDLGNIIAATNGEGVMRMVLPDKKAKAFGGWEALIGRSVVVHEKRDNFRSQPSGDSGARIACGIIERVPAPALGE